MREFNLFKMSVNVRKLLFVTLGFKFRISSHACQPIGPDESDPKGYVRYAKRILDACLLSQR